MTEVSEDIVNQLKNGHSVVIKNTHGRSMEPLLYEGKSQVVVAPLADKPEKGDLLLWRRKRDGEFILHRLVGEDDRFYIMRGDHNVSEEHVKKERVIGVATDICRNGKWFSVTNRRYNAYVRRRMALAPLRSRAYRILKPGKSK